MQLRVTRPGFLNGIRALAFSDAPVPHLPSIEKWRAGGHQDSRDPNVFATRQGQLDLHGPAVAGLRQK
jgi:nitrite reductase (cytochrome c-552)